MGWVMGWCQTALGGSLFDLFCVAFIVFLSSISESFPVSSFWKPWGSQRGSIFICFCKKLVVWKMAPLFLHTIIAWWLDFEGLWRPGISKNRKSVWGIQLLFDVKKANRNGVQYFRMFLEFIYGTLLVHFRVTLRTFSLGGSCGPLRYCFELHLGAIC